MSFRALGTNTRQPVSPLSMLKSLPFAFLLLVVRCAGQDWHPVGAIPTLRYPCWALTIKWQGPVVIRFTLDDNTPRDQVRTVRYVFQLDPTLKAGTDTVPVRFELPNIFLVSAGLVKPSSPCQVPSPSVTIKKDSLFEP